MITTEFQQTPLMSTYLIAFIISNFEYYENVQSSVVHRVYARPNVLIDQIDLPLSNGVQILNELQTYLNIPFLLTKIDQVAVPDFAGGAMENWGLVTYRETSLLWDNTISSYINRRSIIRLISHEFTHQWFGNLVSPQWWSYLWLNEGFATLFANYIVDKIYPEFKLMEQMVVHTMHNVMQSDALQSTHPMSYYVESPNELENIFDSIAYDKAGCVLRMFMNTFTENSFQKGLNYYLTERSHNYATEEHLFIGIERAVKEDNTLADDKNVLTIMSSWTQQNGYPILYVNRNYNTNSILIGQQRYFTCPPETLTNTKYWIPINFVSAQELDFSQTYTTVWLSDSLKTIEKNNNREWSSNDWLIFNKQQSSYYRIQYDQTNWDLIINELLHGDLKKIHVLNRAQIIDDSFTLAQANRLNWNVPLTIMKYLFNEYEYIPWAAFENHLNYFNRYLPGIYNYGNYQNFIQKLIEHLFNEYGIIDNGIDEVLPIKYIRTLAIHWSCAMGLNLCREMTNLRVKELINDNNEIHPNLKNVLYCAGLRTANSNDKEYFLNRMMSVSNIEQNFIINGLGCISNINFLYEYLMESLNVSLTQNIRNGIFNAVYQNSQDGLYLAIVFLTNNFEQSNVILGTDEIVKTTLIELSKLCSIEYIIVAMENLLNVARTNIDFENSIKIANDNIFENIEWLTINEYNIINWLSKNNLDN